MFKIYVLVQIILFIGVYGYVEYKNWAFHFPYGSNMGLYMALALPVDLPNENVFIAYNFEANYYLPGNMSETVEFPPLAQDEESATARHLSKINRTSVYRAIEIKMETYGYQGHQCLLKTICEAASSSFEHNGLVGDLLHILLTPSTTNDTDLKPSYAAAENFGKKSGNCNKYAKNCPTSFLNLITLKH